MTSVNFSTALPAAIQAIFASELVTNVARCRSVYKVQTREGARMVKPLGIGSAQALSIVRLLRENQSCPVLASVITTDNYPDYFWGKGCRYLITHEIPGREADYMALGDLQASIRSMREFHRYTRQVVKNQKVLRNHLQFRAVQQWERRYRELEQCRELAIRSQNPWSRQYLKLWHYFSAQAYQAITECKAVKEAEKLEAICYHDWACHNVIIWKGIAYLFDFDYMLIDHPVHDRANLIGRYLRLHGWTPEALLTILWNFDRLYPWRSGEVSLLRIYLTFPYDYWMLGRQYYLEKQPWSEKVYQDQWQRKVAPYLKREALLRLLEQF